MKSAKVIIGGAFGDEGKGLFTDFLASESKDHACVVRFNGGAQAGHTVQMPDGRRHVFSHFGSGSFAGLPTFLPSYFVCSPIVFLKELNELQKKQIVPTVYIDEHCPVTTPYDIMINQIVESARGKNRHGSVGVGFGESLERHGFLEFSLLVRDLGNTERLRHILKTIQQDWVYARLSRLGVDEVTDEWKVRISSADIRERFMEDVAAFLDHVQIVKGEHIRSWDHLIFEGAQGLLLDQDRGWFPHVTRSNTGIKNVVPLAKMAGIDALDIHYLTRSYTTRHGAGPLPHELQHQPYDNIVDATNRTHAYQGSLRFAWLDVDLFGDMVMRDVADANGKLKLRTHLGLSCLDQITGPARYIEGGVLQSTSPEALIDKLSKKIGAQSALLGFGPTRATVRRHVVRSGIRRAATEIGNKFLKPVDVMQGNLVALQA